MLSMRTRPWTARPQTAAAAVWPAGLAGLPTVGDEEHVHFVAIGLGDERLKQPVRVIG
jgi:hypothetical protein